MAGDMFAHPLAPGLQPYTIISLSKCQSWASATSQPEAIAIRLVRWVVISSSVADVSLWLICLMHSTP